MPWFVMAVEAAKAARGAWLVMRAFKIRACPVCGKVDMPAGRDDWPYCHEPDHVHGGRTVRLAWFEVEETDSEANRLNEEARAAYVPRETNYWEYSYVGGRLWRRGVYSGEHGFVDPAAPEAAGPPRAPSERITQNDGSGCAPGEE